MIVLQISLGEIFCCCTCFGTAKNICRKFWLVLFICWHQKADTFIVFKFRYIFLGMKIFNKKIVFLNTLSY